MKLGYARANTTDQKAVMQVQVLREAGVEEDRIFIDEMSGLVAAKDRPQMAKLLDYARDGDEIYVWRIDRLGRSLVDVINTVQAITERGISLHSIMDGVDPSSSHGRLQLALFAGLAQYERELITERVRSGVMAAQARGVKFGRQAPKQETIETKLRSVRQLLADGTNAAEAAEAVGWSRPTMYRDLKKFGTEVPADAVVHGKGRSQYAAKKVLPERE